MKDSLAGIELNQYTGAKKLQLDDGWNFRCMTNEECEAAYYRLMEERLMWAYWPQHGDDTTLELWMAVSTHPETFPMAFFYNGELVGFAQNFPAGYMSRCMEVNPVMFREFFSLGSTAFWNGSAWLLGELDCMSLLGHTPVRNRHISVMLENIGYNIIGVIPEFIYYSRLKRYDNVYVSIATRESLIKAKEKRYESLQ
ncbi:hypothetical protein [Akkermansia sp.]|uniref:hypothetical protein n=1 Tax=Akkermansia sp. TaxID=1872421 RepID=UPI0025C0D95C|nr:hypothetical protein [Akkermansia sp.]MCD8272416.1 hypothetical protein [Akkermansia sp.]